MLKMDSIATLFFCIKINKLFLFIGMKNLNYLKSQIMLLKRLITFNSIFFILLQSSLVLSQSTVRPNHVSINEQHKHIEVDSNWSNSTNAKVQRVNKF